jgi:hypothetical protein
MRLADGTYECTLCGAILDVPADMTAKVEDAELGGSRDTIVVDGVEIHHCESPQQSGAAMISLVLAVPVPGLLLGLASCV